jgi:hypothetical protein
MNSTWLIRAIEICPRAAIHKDLRISHFKDNQKKEFFFYFKLMLYNLTV